MKTVFLTPLAAAAALLIGTAASAQETFKVAYIDPLSGPFANVGELMLTHTQYAIEDINAKGGVLKGTKLQLLQFDSKLSAQESQSALQAAIDQGAKAIVTGGSGSSVVTALVQAAARHNQRNPGKEILVLNHSSIDPELTGKACNFWHVQFEANTAMKTKTAQSRGARCARDLFSVAQGQEHRGRLGHHRQLGAGHDAAAQGGG